MRDVAEGDRPRVTSSTGGPDQRSLGHERRRRSRRRRSPLESRERPLQRDRVSRPLRSLTASSSRGRCLLARSRSISESSCSALIRALAGGARGRRARCAPGVPARPPGRSRRAASRACASCTSCRRRRRSGALLLPWRRSSRRIWPSGRDAATRAEPERLSRVALESAAAPIAATPGAEPDAHVPSIGRRSRSLRIALPPSVQASSATITSESKAASVSQRNTACNCFSSPSTTASSSPG